MTNTTGTAGFPSIFAPFVTEIETIEPAWHRLLVSLWQRTGGSFSTNADIVFLVNTGSQVEAFDAITGLSLGFLTPTAAGPAEPVVIGASPQVYTALVPGVLAVSAVQSELSRDGGATYYPVSLTGAAIPLLVGDMVRVTWPPNAPVITFFPG